MDSMTCQLESLCFTLSYSKTIETQECSITPWKKSLLLQRDQKKRKQLNAQLTTSGFPKNHYQFEELFFHLDFIVDSCEHVRLYIEIGQFYLHDYQANKFFLLQDILKNSKELDFKNNQMMEMITTQMNNLKMDVSSEKTCIQVLRLFMNLLAQL